MIDAAKPVELTRKDFAMGQAVRWCPGCGDYAILAQVQQTLPKLGIPREDFVVISGIGCSSRFPYYINTFGIHSIHGRAPTLATGLKCARSDLQIWVVTGDGDSLAIGGNHFHHVLRRNVDLNILLFNNRMECASCHDVHNGGTTPGPGLLRITTNGSQLCLTCHDM